MKSKEQFGFDLIADGKKGLWGPIIKVTTVYFLWKIYLIAARVSRRRSVDTNYGNGVLRLATKLLAKGKR